ncbi:MAG: 3-deoxy-8-phosphooctulonate synthase [Ignavibacteria bacterium]|jgi:2-dehydro-3-deoxyphosphooctonate aldolase (KDO 8-P synthase)|nr:3-deoxy-8-phosphooctulonate synthase [Ignavibacteria bacterium]MDH7528545.1 3-deoxy-8-phosphooctulonate synthase [Ignavibacteria bacterium]NPV11298.1 3-deoxy-8-phosphooctulonate synthase [Ignavibacteria bacterium]
MIELNGIKIDNNLPFILIAGPCVVESRDLVFSTAEKIIEITSRLNIPYIFKSSYKKANRTSVNSFTGIGDQEALKILDEIKKTFGVPVLTDVHSVDEVKLAAEVVDILQIPAFLCRQTELLLEAGKTGKVVNIKKGQFLAPDEIQYAADKVKSTRNEKILLTERGTTFGYHNLVVDMRSLVIMKKIGYPVIMDATHAVQIPGVGGKSGGAREFIPYLAKAAISIGIAGLFLETHPEPSKALSDADSQLPLNFLETLLIQVKQIDELVKNFSEINLK